MWATASAAISPYFLLNTGSGQFTQTRTNIPAGNNQLLDSSTEHHVGGATLTDLDGDGLVELIVTADSNGLIDQLRRTTILWNRGGIFAEADTTQLPVPRTFPNTHIDLDVQRIDVNQDGLPDLVLVGTQGGASLYDGWFVQILVNEGNRRFVDETTLRLLPGEASGGREGLKTNAPWPVAVRVVDFNQDGAPDFAVDFNGSGAPFTQDQPLVWLNDGGGHFSTLKVGDFVAAGGETLVLGGPRLMATRNGYSFIEPRLSPKGGLMVTGLLATRPFRMTGPTADLTASATGSSVAPSKGPRSAGGASMSPLSFASEAASLTFDRPAAQGSGTPGFQVVSDPTIRPFQAPSRPATINTTLPIDFQGTGRRDLLACYGYGGVVRELKFPCRVLRPQPDGSVTDVTRQMFGTGTLPSFDNPKEIVTGDFNGDGRPDIFIAATGYDAQPFPGATNGLVISNADGTYADRSSTLPQTPGFAHSACVGDINGDGRLDIYVGNIIVNQVYPYFLMGKGDGTFTQKTTGLPPQFQRPRPEGFLSCLFVDVDRDGYPDLVLGTWGQIGFVDSAVLFNDGTGDFTRRPRYVLPAPPLQQVLGIVSLDINRDGRADLVMQTTSESYTGSGVQVLVDQGNGTFADETVTRLGTSSVVFGGSYCGFLRLADFNGDGWEDFYCNNGPENVPNRYWMSNGDGTWSPVASGVLPPGSGLGIHAVDFDGDARPDLLSISPTGTGDVSYRSYFNRTARTMFTSNVSFPPRHETIDFNTQLENLYRDQLGTSPISAHVDLEGSAVWLTEYARYRVGLCSHADAMTRVFWQINAGVVTGVCGLTPVGAIPFPPRNEGLDFMSQLDSVYRDGLKRSPSSVYVNNEGRVLILDYLRYRLNGCGHTDATTRVFQQVLGQGIQPTCR